MSRSDNALSFASDRSPKVHFNEYLRNINESEETIYDGADTRNDAILIGDSFYEKRKLRRLAKRLRRYSS